MLGPFHTVTVPVLFIMHDITINTGYALKRSHRIQCRDSNPGPPGGNRLCCHLSYRASVSTFVIQSKIC